MSIIVITGKTASGKDSIAQELVKSDPTEFKYVISTTTRKPREKEKEGINYYYTTNDNFETLIATDQLIEYNYREIEGVRNYYGITKGSIDKYVEGISGDNSGDNSGEIEGINNCNQNVICVVDFIGAKNIKKIYNDKVIIVYVSVNEKERLKRFKAREKEFNETDWLKRKEIDDLEYLYAERQVDLVIENNNLNDAVYELIKGLEYINETIN